MNDLIIFSGNSVPYLAKDIAKNLSLPLGKAYVGKFSDGEIYVEIQENVRGKDVFIIQSTSPPTNDNLMELIIMSDALHRASANRITAVIPYFGYARQDRRLPSSRGPITSRIVADIISASGVNQLVTVDIHAEQIQGFFNIPLDNIYASPILISHIKKKKLENVIIVSPDIGGVIRARIFAKNLDCDLAIIDKRRIHANTSQVMNIIGSVKNRHCIIIDDIADTAGTICKAAEALIQKGAKRVSAYCTHPVLSKDALNNIEKSMIDEIVTTNSIMLSSSSIVSSKIIQLNLSKILSETIRRINSEESISSMFKHL